MRTAIRWAFVTVLALLASYGDKATAAGGRRPNIVILLADDKYAPAPAPAKNLENQPNFRVFYEMEDWCGSRGISANSLELTTFDYTRRTLRPVRCHPCGWCDSTGRHPRSEEPSHLIRRQSLLRRAKDLGRQPGVGHHARHRNRADHRRDRHQRATPRVLGLRFPR